MKAPGGHHQEAAFGADRIWAAGLFAAALALYVSTLCRTVYFYDSAELAAASALLGIPHPPGYPLYTLLGHLYALLSPNEPALAVNAMSAVHGALCVALAFMAQRRLGAGQPEAAIGAALLGVGESFWWNASVAEVYTTGLSFVLATFLVLFEGLSQRRPRLLLMAAALAGLGLAAHMFIATLGLGYVLLVWNGSRALPEPSLRARLQLCGQAALAVLAGASVYLYLPLRASANPAIDFAHVDDAGRFMWLVTGGDYKHWFLHDYALWPRALFVVERLATHLTWPGTVVGALGIGLLCRRRPELGWALLLAVVGNLAFFFAYRVHDVEVFFLPSAAVLALAVGPALTMAHAATARTPHASVLHAAALGSCALYLCLRVSLVYPAVDLSSDTSAYDYGVAVARFLPQDAMVLSTQTPPEWKFRAVFEDYFQKTLGARPDVLSLAIDRREALFEALRAGRPTFMYVHIPELDPYATFTPEGPLLRVSPYVVPAR